MRMFIQLDSGLYMASNDDPILVLFENFLEVPTEEPQPQPQPKKNYTVVYQNNHTKEKLSWDVNAPTPTHASVLWRRSMGPLHKHYTILEITKNQDNKT